MISFGPCVDDVKFFHSAFKISAKTNTKLILFNIFFTCIEIFTGCFNDYKPNCIILKGDLHL